MFKATTDVNSLSNPSSTHAPRLSQTACAGCREQKIRCTRHKPVCARCARRKLSCRYPAPPDRKHLAWQRNARQRAASFPEPQEHDSEGQYFRGEPKTSGMFFYSHADGGIEDRPAERPAPPPSAGRPLLEPDHHNEPDRDPENATSSTVDHTSSWPELPAPEISLLLLEVYFSRMFTSGLLFDRPAFVNDFHSNALPKVVLYAVFAQASLYFQPSAAASCTKPNGLGSFSEIREQGRLWAKAASTLVLRDADRPTETHVRVCEILAPYWFAVGEADRSAVHCSLGQSLFSILWRKRQWAKPSKSRHQPSAILSENLRWACWIQSGLVNESTSLDFDVFPLETPLGLPADHAAAPIGSAAASMADVSTPVLRETDWMTWDVTTKANTTTHIADLIGIWKQVKAFVNQFVQSPSPGSIATLFELASKLQNIYQSFPEPLRSERAIRPSSPECVVRNSMFLLSTYHLCVVYLNWSIVPATSNAAERSPIPTSAARQCVQTAYSHARQFAHLARAYIATVPDITKITSFIGYSAYVTGLVLGAVVRCLHVTREDRAWKDGLVCLLFMQELTPYWLPFKTLCEDLRRHLLESDEKLESLSESTKRRALRFNHEYTNPEDEVTKLPDIAAELRSPNNRDRDLFVPHPYIPEAPEVTETDLSSGDVSKAASRPATPMHQSSDPLHSTSATESHHIRRDSAFQPMQVTNQEPVPPTERRSFDQFLVDDVQNDLLESAGPIAGLVFGNTLMDFTLDDDWLDMSSWIS